MHLECFLDPWLYSQCQIIHFGLELVKKEKSRKGVGCHREAPRIIASAGKQIQGAGKDLSGIFGKQQGDFYFAKVTLSSEINVYIFSKLSTLLSMLLVSLIFSIASKSSSSMRSCVPCLSTVIHLSCKKIPFGWRKQSLGSYSYK